MEKGPERKKFEFRSQETMKRTFLFLASWLLN